jgi:DNA-directed RNA polymerase subunit RPC12/RpoP
MAETLIKCETCGKDIANKTLKCPHCGASTAHKRKQVVIGVVIVMIVIIAYIIINYISGMQDAAIQRARGFY